MCIDRQELYPLYRKEGREASRERERESRDTHRRKEGARQRTLPINKQPIFDQIDEKPFIARDHVPGARGREGGHVRNEFDQTLFMGCRHFDQIMTSLISCVRSAPVRALVV